MRISVTLLVLAILTVYAFASRSVSDVEAEAYLERFGYIKPKDVASVRKLIQAEMSPTGIQNMLSMSKEESIYAKEKLHEAIALFQELSGLKVTGKLDQATKYQMVKPRCGVLDVRLYTNGPLRWKKSNLTYEIEAYTQDLKQDIVRRALQEAFGKWSAVVNLNFILVKHNGDIKIKFAVRYHGDPDPFDGRGGVLAHATLPNEEQTSILHFDDDELWAYRDPQKLDQEDYMDVLRVAVHEVGHVLGLEHSQDQNAIMAAYYTEAVDKNGNYIEPELGEDDIQKIQKLYGKGGDVLTSTTTSYSDEPEDNDSWLPWWPAGGFPRWDWPSFPQWPAWGFWKGSLRPRRYYTLWDN